jgi:hypothetical protein
MLQKLAPELDVAQQEAEELSTRIDTAKTQTGKDVATPMDQSVVKAESSDKPIVQATPSSQRVLGSFVPPSDAVVAEAPSKIVNALAQLALLGQETKVLPTHIKKQVAEQSSSAQRKTLVQPGERFTVCMRLRNQVRIF